MSSHFRLGIAQITSGDDVSANIDTVQRLYAQALEQKADLVVFPENALFFRISAGQPLSGPTLKDLRRLSETVGRNPTALMLTTATSDSSGKFTNSTWLWDVGQEPRAVYHKVHLFDVEVPGAPRVRESEYFLPGQGPALVNVKGWTFGLSICYDLRFSELFLPYAQKADVILVPSAFLVPTGQAHWHVLLRARAIEGQCYLAAPAQTGVHRSNGSQDTRETFGHSLVVDPWGAIMEEVPSGESLTVVELQRATLDRVRKQIPMDLHRRLK